VKHFKSIFLLSVAALAGCGEPSYEQCVRDAVKDGKSEYGITILTDLCDEAKSKRLEARDKKCFAELTKKFGEPAVQQYEYMLGGPVGLCDPSVDVPSWISKPENAVSSTGAADAAVEGAIMDAADATADAVEAGADAAQ
jgi:hypothetical protein